MNRRKTQLQFSVVKSWQDVKKNFKSEENGEKEEGRREREIV